MSGTLLGHIVSHDDIIVDPDKVMAIREAPMPSNSKALSSFWGEIRWHSRMIRYLANVATPLHAAVHKMPFQWSTTKQDNYDCLKKMLTKVPIIQLANRAKDFHVFVDASDIAIGSVP